VETNIPYTDLLSHNIDLSKNKKPNSHRRAETKSTRGSAKEEYATETIEFTL